MFVHRVLNSRTALRRIFVCKRQLDVRIDPLVHIVCKPVELSHSAVMRQIQLLGVAGHDAIHGLVRLIRIKACWRRRWKDELPIVGVEFPIGNAEVVAREHTL